MTAPWIRFDKTLPKKPEVRAIAAAVDIDRFSAAARCAAVWAYIDDHSTDGTIKVPSAEVGRDIIDDEVELPGFAAAMESAGVEWLRVTETSIAVPRFKEKNPHSAKSREAAAERKRRQREWEWYPFHQLHG